MTPEQEVVAELLEAVRTLIISSRETLALVAPLPRDEQSFEAMTSLQRMGTTAMIKQFEQLEGALHGLFRGILRCLGVRLKGLYALDIGNRMVELGAIDDAPRWVAIVKLRNDLVHDYPLVATERLDRVVDAHDAFPFLFDAAARAEHVIRERALLPELP